MKKLAVIWPITCCSLLASASSVNEINWWHLGSKYSENPALGWLFITFIIFAYLLIRAIKKPLALYLETRSKDIAGQIEEAKNIKQENEEKLKFYQKKLDGLNQEIAVLKESFLKQAKEERKELAKIALEQKAKILKDTDDTIKSNYKRIKNQLTEEIVKKAINEARLQIEGEKGSHLDSHFKDVALRDFGVSK